MPLIRKEQAGSCPGYVWDNDGDVVDVDADMAGALLAMPQGGFSEVAAPEPGSGPESPLDSGAAAPSGEVVEAPVADPPAPKKRAYTRKTAASPTEVTE
jgi:hypothetical protein